MLEENVGILSLSHSVFFTSIMLSLTGNIQELVRATGREQRREQ